MKVTFASRVAVMLLLGALLAACAPASPAAPAAPGHEVRAVVGFTASQTGNLNVESRRQTNGLNLWIKQTNDAGGVRLEDGSVVKFDARFYYDESNKNRVQELYTRLATKDEAAVLISPYSSGLADAAAVIAEQYNKIMITAGAGSDSTYRRGATLVYQASTPASKYLNGAVDLLRAADPAARKIAIVHENDKNSTDVARALNDYAGAQGYQVVLLEGYDTGTADFAPLLNKIQKAAPDAVLGGGHFQDGTTLARQLYEKRVPVKMLALLVAPPEANFAQIGDGALGVLGPSQWETQVDFTPEAAGQAGLPFYGPSNADFVASYRAAYGEDPSYHAAGGYAAGLILQRAIETAGSLDTQSLQAALDQMDMVTFFGHVRFSPAEADHGLQTGHDMVFIQWQRSAAGSLGKQVVWPAAGATAQLLYPMQ